MSRRELAVVVAEFRSALKGLVDDGHWFGVSITKEFPHASCDDSSLLLAAYLSDQGYPGALRVHGQSGGKKRELNSHVWLDLNGTLIDITGSQFEDYAQPEILIADNDPFLASFKPEGRSRIADFRKTAHLPKSHFYQAYDAICARISQG
ncbi:MULTISPECIES: hypothetical protein [unclassified Pseudomonas]|uniref:hypothetical protein n=1 Tax=unclassified Pseudomonas TaxID=196821 RepID=UPI000CD1CAC5|nr:MULTISPECIES: hypothetical protein [unclassified Pseudomonas]POA52090.1 hypothetical protein C1889_24140 [Pseudomonas sp. FW507-12TSA]